MSNLKAKQWEAMYEGTLRIQRAATLEEFAQESLGCLAVLVPARQHMLFTFDSYTPGHIEFGRAFAYGTSVHYLDTFLSGSYTTADQMFTRMGLKVGDYAYRDSDIIDEDSLMKLRVYNEIYRRDGVHYGMRLNMAANNALVGSYSLFRSKEEGDFTDGDLEVANLLAPLFSLRFRQLIAAEDAPQAPAKTGLSRSEAMEHFGLTAREYQVADLVARGYTDDEVAEALSITASTARKHLYNAYAKLAVNKRSQLESLFGLR